MENNPTRLADLYDSPTLTALLPSKSYVEGFIFAIATAPEIPMPETWMPWLISGSASANSTADFDFLADGLMDGLRHHLRTMRDDHVLLPAHCESTADKPVADTLSIWLTGLLAAHKQLEPCWQRAWTLAQQQPATDKAVGKEDPALRLRRCLKLFTTLADVELALSVRSAQDAQRLQENLVILVKQLPQMLKEYVELAGELAGALPNQFESFVHNTN